MKNIGFLFYASKEWGMGHTYRNIILMNRLKKENNVTVITNSDKDNLNLLDLYDFNIKLVKQDNIRDIENCLKDLNLDILIIDKLNNSKEEIICFKNFSKCLIDIDDQGDGAQFSDILINAIVPLPKKVPNKTYCGPNYMIFNDEIEKYANLNKNIYKKAKNVLVCFGGSDPKNIMEILLPTIINFKELNFDIVFGPAYQHTKKLIKNYEGIENVNFHVNLPSLGKLMYDNDICIISGGITLFESLFIGCPAIVICQVEHQIVTASKYSQDNCLINMGLYENLNVENFKNIFTEMIDNTILRKKLNENSKKTILRNGLYNIIDLIESI